MVNTHTGLLLSDTYLTIAGFLYKSHHSNSYKNPAINLDTKYIYLVNIISENVILYNE